MVIGLEASIFSTRSGTFFFFFWWVTEIELMHHSPNIVFFIFNLFLFFCSCGLKPRALHMVGKCLIYYLFEGKWSLHISIAEISMVFYSPVILRLYGALDSLEGLLKQTIEYCLWWFYCIARLRSKNLYKFLWL